MEKSVFLYDDDHAYEREYTRACLGEEGLELWDMVSEKAPGERYGSMYRVAREYLPRLEEALGTDEEGLLEALKKRYACKNAGEAVKRFCDEKGIPYKSFMAR